MEPDSAGETCEQEGIVGDLFSHSGPLLLPLNCPFGNHTKFQLNVGKRGKERALCYLSGKIAICVS